MILRRSFTLFLLVGVALFSGPVFAQQEEKSQESIGFDLEFNTVFGGYYYQDGLSGLIIGELLPTDGSIDIASYILGPNDLISVNIETNQPILLRGLLINPQGDIVIPNWGNVNVAGKTIAEATKSIAEVASATFKNVKVRLTLERPRPVTIHMAGGVPFPGKKILPPFSRLDLAVYEAIIQQERRISAGTPTPVNTSELLSNGGFAYRNVSILHADNTTQTADLIDYFKTGNLQANPIIRDGDIITLGQFSRENSVIGISGFVHNPQELEYNPTDTPQRLINIAGGLKPEADVTRLLLIRQNENGESTRQEISANEWSTFTLQPNDRLIVRRNAHENINASAWITGEVQIPGNFPIKDGITSAADLLAMAENLTDQALPAAAYLIRAGSVENENPDKFNTEILKRTSDQITQGLQYLDLEAKLSQDRVFIDLTNPNQLASVRIFDGDRLFVPRDEQTVFVFGQVNSPGYLGFEGEKSPRDYIQQAGGFSLSADLDRVFIIKAGSRTWYEPEDVEIESGDMIFVDRVPVDELNAQRNYEIQKRQLRISNTQIILTAVTTITAIITTVVAIRNSN